jgi:hypothetical protein
MPDQAGNRNQRDTAHDFLGKENHVKGNFQWDQLYIEKFYYL